MSKRQRRRVNERRSVHMQHSKRRTVLPLAVAAVAAPAVAAPVAQAAPRVLRLDGTVLKAGSRHANHDALARLTGNGASLDGRTAAADDAVARADNRLRREHAIAAKPIANATRTGQAAALHRSRPNRPRRPTAPTALSPANFAPVAAPVVITAVPAPAPNARRRRPPPPHPLQPPHPRRSLLRLRPQRLTARLPSLRPRLPQPRPHRPIRAARRRSPPPRPQRHPRPRLPQPRRHRPRPRPH